MKVQGGKRKKATVERLFHLEMKGADGERAISKGNIITFSYLLQEHGGGGEGRKDEGEEEGWKWRHRGAFKSNNPSLRYTRSSHSHSLHFNLISQSDCTSPPPPPGLPLSPLHRFLSLTPLTRCY